MAGSALFARWVGPEAMTTRIEHWDARTGGSWRYVAERDGVEYRFRGTRSWDAPSPVAGWPPATWFVT